MNNRIFGLKVATRDKGAVDSEPKSAVGTTTSLITIVPLVSKIISIYIKSI